MAADPTIMRALSEVGNPAADASYQYQQRESDLDARAIQRAIQLQRIEESQNRDKLSAQLLRMYDTRPDIPGIQPPGSTGAGAPTAGVGTQAAPPEAIGPAPPPGDVPQGQAPISPAPMPAAPPSAPQGPGAAMEAGTESRLPALQGPGAGALSQIGTGQNPFRLPQGSYSKLLEQNPGAGNATYLMERRDADTKAATTHDQTTQKRHDGFVSAMFKAIADGQPGAAMQYARMAGMQLRPEDLQDVRTQQFAVQATKMRALYGDDYGQFGNALKVATGNGGNWQAAVEQVPPRRKPLEPVSGQVIYDEQGGMLQTGRYGQPAIPVTRKDTGEQVQGINPRMRQTKPELDADGYLRVMQPDGTSRLVLDEVTGQPVKGMPKSATAQVIPTATGFLLVDRGTGVGRPVTEGQGGPQAQPVARGGAATQPRATRTWAGEGGFAWATMSDGTAKQLVDANNQPLKFDPKRETRQIRTLPDGRLVEVAPGSTEATPLTLPGGEPQQPKPQPTKPQTRRTVLERDALIDQMDADPQQKLALKSGARYSDVFPKGADPGKTERNAQRILENNYRHYFILNGDGKPIGIIPAYKAQADLTKRDIVSKLEGDSTLNDIYRGAGVPRPEPNPLAPDQQSGWENSAPAAPTGDSIRGQITQQPAAAPQGGKPTQEQALAQARAAIAAGKDPAAVRQRLIERGFSADGL